LKKALSERYFLLNEFIYCQERKNLAENKVAVIENQLIKLQRQHASSLFLMPMRMLI
jgi:hypothetical protein